MAFGKDGELRVIVEVPRGSSVKLNYKPKLRSFVVSRALPFRYARRPISPRATAAAGSTARILEMADWYDALSGASVGHR